MNFMFFIYIPLVHSASHIFMTIYTGQNGEKVAGTPEISVVTTLDEEQIEYYDSDTGKLVLKQDWMKDFASGDKWKNYTEIRERLQQTNKTFSQSHGVHVYERMYGCVWDDETEASHGFDDHSYDGEDFISLDLNEGRYTACVQQAKPTVTKWNNDREQLDFLKQYYKHECFDYLKEFLHLSNATSKKTVSQVPGQSLTESIQTTRTVNHTNSSGPSYITYAAISVILILIALCVYRCRTIRKRCLFTGTNKVIYYREYDHSTPDKCESPPDESEQCQSDARTPDPSALQLLTRGTPTQPYPSTQESFYKDQETSEDFKDSFTQASN